MGVSLYGWVQGSNKDWKIWKMNVKNLVGKSHGILPILLLNVTKFVPFLSTLRNLGSAIPDVFYKMSRNLSTEMVVENCKMVIEKS